MGFALLAVSLLPSALLAVKVPHPKDLEAITAAVRARDWTAATSACERTSATVWKKDLGQRVPSAFYAELFGRCAAAASGAGDEDRASWFWHAAHIFDAKIADGIGEQLAGFAALPVLRTGRHFGPAAVAWEKDRRVESPNGEMFEGVRAGRIGGPMPDVGLVTKLLRPGHKMAAYFEVVVGADGRAREPVLVEVSNTSPNQVFVILQAVRDWTYEPAKRDGHPVASVAVFHVEAEVRRR